MSTDPLLVHMIPPGWDLPSIGPFTLKLEAYLRMIGREHETVVDPTPFKGPKKKLPWIEHRGRQIGDSNLIIDYFEKELGDDLDGWMSPAERGVAQALLRLLEENLYWVMVHDRWLIEANWRGFKPIVLAGVPAPVRPLVAVVARRGVRRQLAEHGIGRHTVEEIHQIGVRDLDAVADVLGDKPFLMGDQPAKVDAAAYGLLANILLVPIESPVKAAGLKRPRLVEYLDRIRTKWFG